MKSSSPEECASTAAGNSKHVPRDFTFEIDYLFNAALMVRTDTACILVDALAADNNFFDCMEPSLEEKLLNGSCACDAAVFTHTHSDHYDKGKILRFMRNHPECRMILPEDHGLPSDELTEQMKFDRLFIMRDSQAKSEITVGNIQLSYQKIEHLEYDHSTQFCIRIAAGSKALLVCADAAPDHVDELKRMTRGETVMSFFNFLMLFKEQWLRSLLEFPSCRKVLYHVPGPDRDRYGYRDLLEKKMAKYSFGPSEISILFHHPVKLYF